MISFSNKKVWIGGVILLLTVSTAGFALYSGQLISKLQRVPLLQKSLRYPDDFVIPPTQLPKHFVLAPVPEAYEKRGISNPAELNPSDFDDSEADQGLDPKKIEKIYHTVYLAPKEEFGVMLIRYNSESDLDSELPEFIGIYSSAQEPRRYRFLRTDTVLIFIWTDGDNYNDLDVVSAYYKKKRGIKPIPHQ